MGDSTISSTRTEYVVIRDETGEQVTPNSIGITFVDPSHTGIEGNVDQVATGDLALAAAALGEELTSNTGVYQCQITPDIAGTWWFHWQAYSPDVAIWDWFQVPWPPVNAVATS